MVDGMDLRPAIDWSALQKQLSGALIFSGDEDMVIASKQYGAGAAPVLPGVCICCLNAEDVRLTLAFLHRHRLNFAVRSGGHCFADLSSSAQVVIDLAGINHIEMQADSVRVGPGVCAADLSRHLSAAGRVVPTGGCPWVAIGGLALVGGFGFLGRYLGLLADQITRFEVATATGDLLEVDAQRHADLYWALRGAGAGGFGIVTALNLRTHPLPALIVCHGQWPLQHAVTLIERWQKFALAAPIEINLELGLVAPDDGEEPCYIELFGIVIADSAEPNAQLETVRNRLGTLAADIRCYPLFGAAAADYLVGLIDHQTEAAWQPSRPYRTPGYQFTHSDFFEQSLSRAAIVACVSHFADDRRYMQHRELELIPWQGAYARDDGHSCFAHRSAQMLIRHTAVLGHRSTAPLREHARQWVQTSRDTLAAHANGHVYQGYADQTLPNWQAAYYGDHYARLQSIKRRYDPENLFRHAQSIAPG